MCHHPHYDPTCTECHNDVERLRDIFDGLACALCLAVITLAVFLFA